MQIKTSNEISRELTLIKGEVGEMEFRHRKFVSVDDIFKWEKEYPEDNFEDFLACLDEDKYFKEVVKQINGKIK